MKLTIVIEGTPKEINAIAVAISDGGADQQMTPVEFEDDHRFLKFDYSKCFPAWGYDPKKHGKDKVITAVVSKEIP